MDELQNQSLHIHHHRPPTNQNNMMFSENHADEAVIIVCPYSTGCCVALELQLSGFNLVCVWPSKSARKQYAQHLFVCFLMHLKPII